MIKEIREELPRYENKGYTITIHLPEECGHEGYSVDCRYMYDKERNKYMLSMWLMHESVDDKFKIDSQGIDTQLINGTKENIKRNICKLVKDASLSGYFDPYIERYEYTYRCFERGNELFEMERLGVSNAS